MKACRRNRRAAEKRHPEITVRYQEKLNSLWDEAKDLLADLREKWLKFKSEKKSVEESFELGNGNPWLYTDDEENSEEDDY